MSFQKLTRVSISATMMLVLMLSMLAPVGVAFAQDGDPPPDPPPAEEVVVEEAETPAEEEPVAEEPVEEETPPTEEPIAEEETVEQEEPVADEQPEGDGTGGEAPAYELPGEDGTGNETGDGEEAPVEEPLADELADADNGEAGEEENPIAEAVQALDGADAMLLDEEGEPLSMASQEAADTLAAPDPQFCPAGLSFGDAGCYSVQTTMAAAITDALTAAASGISGTIFVESGTFDGDGAGGNVDISGFTYGTSLTIQGNADGGGTTNFSTLFDVSANTFSSLTFNDVTFEVGVVVDGNSGDLSINNVVADASSGAALLVSNHDGAVSLDNVTTNNTGTASVGASIDNTASSTDAEVTINDGNFNGFNNNGLLVQSDGAITLSGVTANGNGDEGAVLDNTSGSGPNSINVSGSIFNNNGSNGTFSGLLVDATGTILLSGVTADGNTGDGVTLNSGVGTGPTDIIIKCSALTNNGGNGFTANANNGDLGLYSVTTSGNTNAFATTNVTNISFKVINCNPDNDDGVKHPRDGQKVECDPDEPTTIELDLYAHSITFPPMDISGCNGFARSLFNNAQLPGELPEDSEFLRGLSIQLEGCELPEGKAMTIGFDIPATELENEFAVLFWDKESGTWIEIPGMLTEDGRYTVNWPETGNFVLVTK
ncbi:MAG: hypothetical protein DWQ07_09680 [Chloroflexi bacterium]|nr:MAG: hypothetical protein DWQ07_09680 [Chloroflexota bacterium]MBL1193016.1 hypothetical protein [Chloroflexota bacterium]NOH10309.1 hypothetical protein [Chloroflexota bacterium]